MMTNATDALTFADVKQHLIEDHELAPFTGDKSDVLDHIEMFLAYHNAPTDADGWSALRSRAQRYCNRWFQGKFHLFEIVHKPAPGQSLW